MSTVSQKTIKLERRDGVTILTLNRPDVLNALNLEIMAEARAAMAAFAKDEEARVLLLTGAGRGFCAGADLAELGLAPEGWETSAWVNNNMKIAFNPLVAELAALEKPTICAVNGIAAGGGVGVALAADIVLAARSSSFVQVFGPRLGLVPDMGCTWLLTRLVSRAQARGMTLLGDKLPAETAEDWGLIWKCVDDAKLMEEAFALAQRLAKAPSNAMGEIKRALDTAETRTLSEQLDYERETQAELVKHDNYIEGVKAFLEKREPQFNKKR